MNSDHDLDSGEILECSNKLIVRALEATRRILLSDQEVGYDELHSLKSLLYVAIERTGCRAEKIFAVQRMLRELLSIVAAKAALKHHERRIGLQIIRDIEGRYGNEL
ncbi:MAG: hypothetical protein ACOY3K_06790 [Candidatus Omnitrophota bacterium]